MIRIFVVLLPDLDLYLWPSSSLFILMGSRITNYELGIRYVYIKSQKLGCFLRNFVAAP